MKRIVICMDGTWQSLNQQELTNIGLIARSVAHKETRPDKSYVYQTVIYTQGVGSATSAVDKRGIVQEFGFQFNRLFGGALGEGLEDAVLDTYMRLAFDYEAGDEIYIFGFSRGAFAARRLSGLINTAGIVSRRFTHKAREGFRLYYAKPRSVDPPEKIAAHEAEARQFRKLYGKGERDVEGRRVPTETVPPIKYLGVFDTVVQRGFNDVAGSLLPWGGAHRLRFKNYRVSSNVEFARHAVAVDENRLGFPVRLWDNIDEDNARLGQRAYQQRWFVGMHGDVGGGDGSQLAALALKWVAEGAAQAGLRFYAKHGEDVSPLDETLAKSGLRCDAKITRPDFLGALAPLNYPWKPRKVWQKREPPTAQDLNDYFDASVLERASAKELRYRPGALKPFRKAMKDWTPAAK